MARYVKSWEAIATKINLNKGIQKGGALMKHNIIHKTSLALLLLSIGVFWAVQVFGQDWSVAQKEVWKMQEAYWELWQKEGSEQLMDLVHKEAAIWGSVATFPGIRLISGLQDGLGSTIDSFELKPYQIKTFSNVAIIQYESKGNFLGKPFRLRCTAIWMKQDGKWLLIGAMHDSCTKLPPCP